MRVENKMLTGSKTNDDVLFILESFIDPQKPNYSLFIINYSLTLSPKTEGGRWVNRFLKK